jgi:hypothetical protein
MAKSQLMLLFLSIRRERERERERTIKHQERHEWLAKSRARRDSLAFGIQVCCYLNDAGYATRIRERQILAQAKRFTFPAEEEGEGDDQAKPTGMCCWIGSCTADSSCSNRQRTLSRRKTWRQGCH